MPKVVAQMTGNDTSSAPAIAKILWTRAASQTNSGSTMQTGLNESQDPVGATTIYVLARPRTASAPAASITSPGKRTSRLSRLSSINNGATTTMPTASDRNQVRQTSQNGAAICNSVIITAPPTADVAVARAAAPKKPTTRRRSPKVNGRPNHRSSSQATSMASPALQNPLRMDVERFLSLRRLAATVPRTMPNTEANPARRPAAIRIPAASPEAGQNTATSEGVASKDSPAGRPRNRRQRYPRLRPTSPCLSPRYPWQVIGSDQ